VKKTSVVGSRMTDINPILDHPLFAAFFQASPDMLYVHGPDGRLIDVNPQVEKVTGFSREELLTLPPERLMGEGYRLEEALDRLARARAGEAQDFTWMARTRSGEEFPVEVRLRPLALDEPGRRAREPGPGHHPHARHRRRARHVPGRSGLSALPLRPRRRLLVRARPGQRPRVSAHARRYPSLHAAHPADRPRGPAGGGRHAFLPDGGGPRMGGRPVRHPLRPGGGRATAPGQTLDAGHLPVQLPARVDADRAGPAHRIGRASRPLAGRPRRATPAQRAGLAPAPFSPGARRGGPQPGHRRRGPPRSLVSLHRGGYPRLGGGYG